jgi:hypothetical protein
MDFVTNLEYLTTASGVQWRSSFHVLRDAHDLKRYLDET